MRAFGVGFSEPRGRAWVTHQMLCGSDRSLHQIAATVGADIGKRGRGAVGTKRALKRADARVVCLWRQVLVTTFAIWL